MVSETTDKFLNQVKLCLYSLRKNGGALSSVPVTLITNSETLGAKDSKFIKEHFSPIEFVTCPRLGAIPHTSKLNVFYAIEPSSYDILIYMDCDTVVRKSLDHIIDPIINEGGQFICRRGGRTDRDRFVNFDALVARFCGQNCKSKIFFEGKEEWPMFNSGVFLITPEAARKIRRDSIEFTYALFDEWQKIYQTENLPFIKYLYRFGLLKTRQKILDTWPIEQGSIALACIKSGVNVRYLDQIYNHPGHTDDFRVLHCFKSVFKFDRGRMYSGDWCDEYLGSEYPGKVFLAKIVREFVQEFPEISG
jgi:hypothetical protein